MIPSPSTPSTHWKIFRHAWVAGAVSRHINSFQIESYSGYLQ